MRDVEAQAVRTVFNLQQTFGTTIFFDLRSIIFFEKIKSSIIISSVNKGDVGEAKYKKRSCTAVPTWKDERHERNSHACKCKCKLVAKMRNAREGVKFAFLGTFIFKRVIYRAND